MINIGLKNVSSGLFLDPITGPREREGDDAENFLRQKIILQLKSTSARSNSLEMEAAGNGGGGGSGEPQLLISGVGGDQPLVMSAEDAAQFLAQAGLQLADVTDSGEQVIINSAGLENAAGLVKVCYDLLYLQCFFGKFSYLFVYFVFMARNTHCVETSILLHSLS